MTEDQFKELLLAGDAKSFVTHQLFDDSCWLFNQPTLLSPETTFAGVKANLADLLNVSPRSFTVVGSGKYGWSMSPTKGVRPFDPENSDIDIVIVSQPLFDTAWAALRAAYYAGYGKYKAMHAYHVFARALVLDGAEHYQSQYLQELAQRLSDLNSIVGKSVRLKKSAKYRVYADWDDATKYHIHGVETMRKRIADGHA